MFKQAITYWTFGEASPEKWTLEKTCEVATELGLSALEVVPHQDFSVLQKHGLTCALTPSHLFVRGMNNKNHWAECHTLLKESILANASAGFPNVVTFTGFLDTTAEKNGSVVTFDEGIENCVEGYKQIVGLAEKNNVNICLESLNTVDDHPLKGHPGYQAEHVQTCIDIIERVGSPNLKLLFDAYHIQIMDGDLIRKIHTFKDHIAHVQIAGVPGRGAPDENQEVNFAAVAKALVDIDYNGYVAHEWIPNEDAFGNLQSAVALLNGILTTA